MATHMFALLAIILMAGVFGGLFNYYMQAHIENDSTSMPRAVLAGLVFSFLVPLVLFLVSNDLVMESQGDPSGMLIFAGFCLIAAWSSRFFTTTITKRIMQESQQARQGVEDLLIELRLLQRALEPMLEMETEQTESDAAVTLSIEEQLDVTTANVLTALGNGRYIFRSVKGLEQETGLDESTLHKTLAIVVSRELGGKILSQQGTRWFISGKGRQYLAAAS